MNRVENIETIKKRFKDEWLLIKVDQIKNSKPIKGSIIDHSSDRAIIYKEISRHNRRYPVFVTYSRDDLPKGYAAAFSLNV